MKNDKDDLLNLAAEFRSALRGAVFMIRRLDTGADLTSAQLTILNMVAQRGERVSTIADNLGVKAPSATEAIKKLEGLGLLRRDIDPTDSRGVLVSLTDKGREAAAESNRRRDEITAELLGALGTRKLELLRKAMPIVAELSENFDR